MILFFLLCPLAACQARVIFWCRLHSVLKILLFLFPTSPSAYTCLIINYLG